MLVCAEAGLKDSFFSIAPKLVSLGAWLRPSWKKMRPEKWRTGSARKILRLAQKDFSSPARLVTHQPLYFQTKDAFGFRVAMWGLKVKASGGKEVHHTSRVKYKQLRSCLLKCSDWYAAAGSNNINESPLWLGAIHCWPGIEEDRWNWLKRPSEDIKNGCAWKKQNWTQALKDYFCCRNLRTRKSFIL